LEAALRGRGGGGGGQGHRGLAGDSLFLKI